MNKKELDLLDKKIIYYLDVDSRQSVSTLAKKIKVSKETTNLRIKKLVSKGYIKGFVTTLFTSHLGMYYYKIFYKFHKITPKIEQEIIEVIKKYNRTAWFGSFEGPYEMAFLLIAESLYDLDNFLLYFREKFGGYILDQQIHIVTSVNRFNLKFFYDASEDITTAYPKNLRKVVIDKEDIKIINFLANNSRISVANIAKTLKMDPSTIIYRIRNLKEKQIFGRHVLAVDFEKFGFSHFQINFKFKNNKATEQAILYFSSHKNATFATVTLGKYDLAIELVARNVAELKEIIDGFREKYTENILDHDTFLITKEHIVTWLPSSL